MFSLSREANETRWVFRLMGHPHPTPSRPLTLDSGILLDSSPFTAARLRLIFTGLPHNQSNARTYMKYFFYANDFMQNF
jgi:hypothetical protein